MLYNHNESEIWGCAQMLATLAEAVLKEYLSFFVSPFAFFLNVAFEVPLKLKNGIKPSRGLNWRL